MDIRNQTPFETSLAIGMGPDRAAHIGVVVKATYAIPERADEAPALASTQIPIAGGDAYHKGDITGSVRTEADTVVFKPRADVLLVGTAHAPGGEAVTTLDVGLRVGERTHTMRVVGDREWRFPTALVVVPTMTAPEPFTTMPLLYERAFGGFDHKGGGWCPQNPIGRGFIAQKARETVDGRLLPNLEDPRHPVRSWDDRPEPVGWGPFGKAWQPRAALTGTAIDDLHPAFGLPADFDHGFFNAAHPALQVPGYLDGDETVELWNVTPDGHRRFDLPGVHPAITVQTYIEAGDDPGRATRAHPFAPVLDTLALFPDDGVFALVWRASRAVEASLESALRQIAAIDIGLGAPQKGRDASVSSPPDSM